MAKDKKASGNFLREMIKQAGISQSTFYPAAEGRGEVPADTAKLIADHPAKLAIIRETLTSLLAAQG